VKLQGTRAIYKNFFLYTSNDQWKMKWFCNKQYKNKVKKTTLFKTA
jgi:hypothetical protein